MRDIRLRRPRYLWVLPLVLILGAILAFTTLVVVGYIYQPAHLNPMFRLELARARQRDIQQAFRDNKPLEPGEVPAGVADLINAFGATTRNEGFGSDTHWDCPRMLEEIALQLPANLARRVVRLDQSQFMAGFRRGIKELAVRVRFEKVTIRDFRWLIPDREGVVVTRFLQRLPDDSLVTTKARLWVIKDSGTWRIYDYEDLEGGGRMSVMMSGMFQQLDNSPNAADLIGRLEAFREAQNLILDQQFEEARRALLRLDITGWPTMLQANYHLQLAAVEFQAGNLNEALNQLKGAEACDPNMPAINMMRVLCYYNLEEYERVVAPARTFINSVGPDAQVAWILGHALRELDRMDEAAVAYGQSLDDDPDNVDVLIAFRGCLREEDKGQLGPRLMALSEPSKHFKRLVDDAVTDEDVPAAEAYVTAYRKAMPQALEGICEEIYLLANSRDNHARALSIYEAEVLRLDSAEKKQELADKVSWRFSYSGLPLAFYEATPPALRLFVFDRVAMNLRDEDENRYDEAQEPLCVLSALIDRHAEDFPDDDRLFRHRAFLASRFERFEEAEALFLLALEKERDEAGRQDIQGQRIANWLQAGRPQTAYEKVPPPVETFRQVARTLIWNQHKGLEPILALHRTRHPEDPYIAYVEGRLQYSQGHWAKALRKFASFREHVTGPQDPIRFEHSYAAQLQVRCLAQLGRTQEARAALIRYQEIDNLERNTTAEVLTLLIDAVEGNLAEVAEQIQKRKEDGWYVPMLYRDPDLGPILRTSSFQRLVSPDLEPWWWR